MTALEHFSLPFSSRVSCEASACVAASLSMPDDRRARHQRSDPAIAECRPSRRSLRNQVFVGQALSGNRIDKTVQPLQRVTLHVTSVQSKSELVNVAIQVFRTGVMVDANQPAFEHSPNTFDSVDVNRSASVHAFGVINCAVAEE